MAPTLDLIAAAAADQQQRQVGAGMRIRVRHPGAVENHHVVQQRAVAVRRRAQLVQVVRKQTHVIGVDLRELLVQHRVMPVVRTGVV